MFKKIRKRDGRIQEFNEEKIFSAIEKAVRAVNGKDFDLASKLGRQAILLAETRFHNEIPEVEEIQNQIEEVLIRAGHVKTARAYILYREKRRAARDTNALIGSTIRMFKDYLDDEDWLVKENANQQKSVNGLNNYVRESFTKHFWLHEVYPETVRQAHLNGSGHIHDLGFLGPYCAGWDLQQLLTDGFGGVSGKVASKPAKHLRSFLGQIVNSTFTTQGECAGAQAWSSFDTYCAPFIRQDALTFEQVKQSLQEFVFNLNVPTRVGFQPPFSNLTFDLRPPKSLQNTAVILGGAMQDSVYGDYQKEMDMLNKAFCDVMLEGDALGRVFTFPIPTINVTKDFPWKSESVKAFMKTAARYGIPYFANYVNSDLSPEDAVSMCCRLRLDTSELKKRGGGLFGSNPLTGSIGVYTVNLPRIGYLAKTETEFFEQLLHQMELGKTALEIKRKEVEKQTASGMYPFSAHYLRNVFEKTGNYWHNHFSTIGIIGMHEAMLNFYGEGIETERSKKFAIQIMKKMRSILLQFQKETGHVYNLEATPAEGASHRLALLDKAKYPDIQCSGEEVPYYVNSSQLPSDFTEDIFEVMDHQDDLQSLYTGGTVQHLYLGQSVEDSDSVAELLHTLFTHYKMPYVSMTPTFSVCPKHGFLKGLQEFCPKCSRKAEIWSRVVGYLRPVQDYNSGKKKEFSERQFFEMKTKKEQVSDFGVLV